VSSQKDYRRKEQCLLTAAITAIFIQRQLLLAGYPPHSQPGKPSPREGLWEGWRRFKDSSHVILYLCLFLAGGIKKQKGKRVTGRVLIKPDLQLIGNISKLLEEKQPTDLAFGAPCRERNCY